MYLSPIIAQYWPQGEGLQGMYDIIEFAGRTCYDSRNKIVMENGVSKTSEEFFNKIIKILKHQSVSEHASVYLKVEECPVEVLESPYTTIKGDKVTTNYRVLLDNDCEYLAEKSHFDGHEPRLTFEIQTGIDISREGLRHRKMSFTERSTRYVLMSNMGVSKPTWVDMNELTEADEVFLDAMRDAEAAYKKLIELGWKKEQARKVLPLATESNIIITGTLSQWKAFIDLRGEGTHAHPDMIEVAEQINDYIKMYYED